MSVSGQLLPPQQMDTTSAIEGVAAKVGDAANVPQACTVQLFGYSAGVLHEQDELQGQNTHVWSARMQIRYLLHALGQWSGT